MGITDLFFFFPYFLQIEFLSLRKKCPYSELLWSAFSRIRAEYTEIQSSSPYSVRMRENADQNNPKYGHFSRSVFSYESACFFKTPVTQHFMFSLFFRCKC